MIDWIFLGIASFFNVAGNLFMKKFAMLDGAPGRLSYVSPWFLSGVFFYGLNLVAYTKAIRHIPVVVAYPVLVGGTAAFVVLGSVMLFAEKLSATMMTGIIITMIGVSVISLSTR